jgi:hypothetical protein
MDGEPRLPSRFSENRGEALSFLQNSMRNCDAMIGEIKTKDKRSVHLQTTYHQIHRLKYSIDFYTSVLSRRGDEQLTELETKKMGIVEEDIRALYKFQGETDNFDPERVDMVVSRMRKSEDESHDAYIERLKAVKDVCVGEKNLIGFYLNEGNDEDIISQGLWLKIEPYTHEPGKQLTPIDFITGVEDAIRAKSYHVSQIAFPDHHLGALHGQIESNLSALEQLPIMPEKSQLTEVELTKTESAGD